MNTSITNNKENSPFLSFQNKNIVDENRLNDGKILPEILFISTYPPRECGIATYSNDLIKALKKQYVYTFNLRVCAVENDSDKHVYSDSDVKYKLNTSNPLACNDISISLFATTCISLPTTPVTTFIFST